MIEAYIEFIQENVGRYGYGLLFLGMFFENTLGLALLVPGLLIILMGGFYAGSGDLNPWLAWFASYLGTICGDNLSYGLGRYGWRRLKFLHRHRHQIVELEQRVRRNNQWFLTIFHFPVYSRMIVPVGLGVVRFPFRTWFLFDLLGAALFVSVFFLIGYFVAKTTNILDDAVRVSNYIQYGFLILLAVWLITLAHTIWKFWQKERSRE